MIKTVKPVTYTTSQKRVIILSQEVSFYESKMNTYLTKSGQNANLWTFVIMTRVSAGIGRSRRATKFLKIKRIIF